MTNITFSIDADLHRKMRAHPEIKWTEILRKSIRDYLARLDQAHQIPMQELRDRLAASAIATLDNIDEQREDEFNAKVQEMEEERLQELSRLEQQGEE